MCIIWRINREVSLIWLNKLFGWQQVSFRMKSLAHPWYLLFNYKYLDVRILPFTYLRCLPDQWEHIVMDRLEKSKNGHVYGKVYFSKGWEEQHPHLVDPKYKQRAVTLPQLRTSYLFVRSTNKEVQKPSIEGTFAQALISLAPTRAKTIKVWTLTQIYQFVSLQLPNLIKRTCGETS